MHTLPLLHSLFEDASVNIHKKNQESLFAITENLLYGRKLTLSDLGRTIQNKIDIKHSIKWVDRFFSLSVV